MSAAVVPLEVRVEQAREAAAAGHWRMAELYTDRALQLVVIERAKYREALRRANRRLRAHRMGESLGGYVQGLGEIVQESFQPVVDAFERVAAAFGRENRLTRDDFVLTSALEQRDQRLLDVMYAMQAGEVLIEDQRRFL